MVRLRFSFTALALVGLMAPTAARADNALGWPAQPVSSSASPAGSTAEQSSYEEYEPDAPLAPSAQANTAALAPAANSSCTSSSCMADCCRNMGDCRGRCWQSFVGVEASLLAPVMNHGGGGASYHYAEGVGPGNSATTTSVNGAIITPRIWAGVMGEYWGFGVRYWRFANTQGGIATPLGGTPVAGANEGLFNQSYLRLQTVDLEVIRRLYVNQSQIWLSGGVRYGQLTRTGIVSGSNTDGTTSVSGTAWTGTGFNGVGPTVALYGWRAIGDTGSWNVFYGGRSSYLWDNNSASSQGVSSSATGGTTVGEAVNTRINNANAFVGELNLGVQYNHCLKCIPATAFFRLAGEYQYWHLNNSANSITGLHAGSLGGGPGFPSANVNANAQNSTIGLLGFGVSTGFMY